MKIINEKLDLKKYANSKIGMRKQKYLSYGETLNSGDTSANMELLWECQRYWESLRDFRERRMRARKFYRGDQWSDLVRDPKSGNMMREDEYLRLQGRVPLKQNRIRQLGKNLIGQFLSNPSESIVLTRKRTDAEVTEMLTNALQYATHSNMTDLLDARLFEEFILSGSSVQKLTYEYIKERNIEDVNINNINPHTLFFNSDVKDPRLRDLRIIGEIIDTTVDNIVSVFAKTQEDERRIRQIYGAVMDSYDHREGLSSRNTDRIDFFTTNDISKARMYEVWRLKGEWRTYVHDPLDMDNPYSISHTPLKEIARLNQERVKLGRSQGMEDDEIPLMEAEEKFEQFWYVKYLTPTGYCLFEGETPYSHEEHPYILLLYPLVDSEVWGFVEDIIDQQKYINRLIVMQDMIISASAKGVLMIPEDLIPEGMTVDDYAEEWTRFNGVIVYKPSQKHNQMPHQISSNSTNVGMGEMVAMQMQLIQEISGVHNAIQGIAPQSGTPANRFALETQNASLNSLDIMTSFQKGFKEKRDKKMLKLITQYYKDERYLAINGRTLNENSRLYKPRLAEGIDFDIVITEGKNTPVYRQIIDDTLLNMLNSQLIDIELYLEHTSLPFADSLLQDIKLKKEQVANGQMANIDPNMVQQAVGNANPDAMALAQKAMGKAV